MARFVKYLSECKDLSSIPNTQVKARTSNAHTCHANPGEVESAGSHASLASQ